MIKELSNTICSNSRRLSLVLHELTHGRGSEGRGFEFKGQNGLEVSYGIKA